MTFSSRRTMGLVSFVLLVMVVSPVRAQITTNTALPVGKGEGIVRLQSKLIRSTGDPSPMDRDLRVLGYWADLCKIIR